MIPGEPHFWDHETDPKVALLFCPQSFAERCCDGCCESINGWIAIPKVRCGICAVSTMKMCFYACRISLISGLSNEDLICWSDS